MSIINQALKKAQRERLLHETQGLPHVARQHTARATRRWPLCVGGLAVTLSIVAVLHAWLSAPRPSTAVDTAPPVTTPYTASERSATPAMSSVIMSPPPDATEHTVPAGASHTAMSQRAELTTTVPALRPPPAPSQVPAMSPQSVLSPPPAPSQDRPSAVPPSTASPVASVPLVPTEQARSQARDLFNQAIEAHKSGRQADALTLLQQSITLDPDLKAAYNSLGNVYYELQQYRQALQMYQKALDIDPDYAKARNNLGSTYLRLAMDDRAREELHKALQADSTYGLAYYNLACVYARAGDSAAAAQYLQQAITLEPQARTWARVDDDFARVRTAPEIQPLLGPS